MASLKDIRVRIASVKSTRRITSAMKMVASSKLRRAEELVNTSRPYADRMERMMASLADSVAGTAGAPRLLAGSGSDQTHLLIVISADRGLCGGFNTNIIREARRRIAELESQGKTVKLYLIGRKANAILRAEAEGRLLGSVVDLARPAPTYDSAVSIGQDIAELFDKGEFDVCSQIFNRFVSAMTQTVTPQQLIPFAPLHVGEEAPTESTVGKLVYDFEPSEEEILHKLLPLNMTTQIFMAVLESFASEQGARMTAMDSATRNAGELIDKLTLTYNRTRQAKITSELIEIISGAEAV